MAEIPEDKLEMVCLIECPKYLFPFSRKIIADLIRDGGYPPLLIDPIDFGKLYKDQKK